jgi:hypothetical protein
MVNVDDSPRGKVLPGLQMVAKALVAASCALVVALSTVGMGVMPAAAQDTINPVHGAFCSDVGNVREYTEFRSDRTRHVTCECVAADVAGSVGTWNCKYD